MDLVFLFEMGEIQQAHARKSDTPGPGKYRTDMDLPMNKCKGHDWVRQLALTIDCIG